MVSVAVPFYKTISMSLSSSVEIRVEKPRMTCTKYAE